MGFLVQNFLQIDSNNRLFWIIDDYNNNQLILTHYYLLTYYEKFSTIVSRIPSLSNHNLNFLHLKR